jgi:class 3 adenylate cyclase
MQRRSRFDPTSDIRDGHDGCCLRRVCLCAILPQGVGVWEPGSVMAEERIQRRLAAVAVLDVVGYSRMMETDEAGTVARLAVQRKP